MERTTPASSMSCLSSYSFYVYLSGLFYLSISPKSSRLQATSTTLVCIDLERVQVCCADSHIKRGQINGLNGKTVVLFVDIPPKTGVSGRLAIIAYVHQIYTAFDIDVKSKYGI